MENKREIVIISRTDSIGDVVLTLPMAGILKQKNPNLYIYFLGKTYTKPLVECCEYVDDFLDWSEIQQLSFEEQATFFKNLSAKQIIHVLPNQDVAKVAKKAKIPIRTGTRNRWYHWLYCNQLVKLSRRKSNLHEAQLNLKLLPDFLEKPAPSLEEISGFYGLNRVEPLPDRWKSYIASDKINVILHTKSKGSGREWGLENFAELIQLLPKERYNIILTGTEEEGTLFREKLAVPYPFVHDLSGKLSLKELISLIRAVDALVACSTGPLHVAAALKKTAIGIYPPIRPLHPGRWSPVGENAHVLVKNIECEKCRESKDCECIRAIKPEQVMEALEKYAKHS